MTFLSFDTEDFEVVVEALEKRDAEVAAYCAATGRCASCQAEIDILGHVVDGNRADSFFTVRLADGRLGCSSHTALTWSAEGGNMQGPGGPARYLTDGEAALLRAPVAGRAAS